jgi:hypothetical protein
LENLGSAAHGRRTLEGLHVEQGRRHAGHQQRRWSGAARTVLVWHTAQFENPVDALVAAFGGADRQSFRRRRQRFVEHAQRLVARPGRWLHTSGSARQIQYGKPIRARRRWSRT